MKAWADHLIILPIVLPLVAGALMLLVKESNRTLKAAINIVATLATLVVTVLLLRQVDAASAPLSHVYLLGNWPAPFGIVLVADRLSAMMLLLTSILALCSVVFSIARWHRAGIYFHPLFQFQLMGLNGAFLTGDLFNLFVFFEVLLAASYGLVLHGSGIARVRAGLHYITVNLTTSVLFLIGVALIYGVTGTLNMADLATRIPTLTPDARVIFESGAAVLGIAFLVKAAMWPLSFWLPTAYAAATPPVAALFAIMSKVGVYVVLRLSLLLFGPEAGTSAAFGGTWLFYGGLMTVAFGAIGALAAQDMGRLAGFGVLISSGTLLALIGERDIGVTGGGLFYLVSSTMAIAAFFLLIELVERGREAAADVLAVTLEAFGDEDAEEEEEPEAGVAVPAIMAVLGVSFVCCGLLLAGLPPLSGFVAKFVLLTAVFDLADTAPGGRVAISSWLLVAMLLFSGLAMLIAMTRAGIRSFWTPIEREVPRVRVIEIAPVMVLLLLCVTLTVQAGPVMRYMHDTAQALHAPHAYIRDVLSAPPVSRMREGGRS